MPGIKILLLLFVLTCIMLHTYCRSRNGEGYVSSRRRTDLWSSIDVRRSVLIDADHSEWLNRYNVRSFSPQQQCGEWNSTTDNELTLSINSQAEPH